MDVLQQKLRDLKDLMNREAEKLEELAGMETRLQRCVLDKNWAELEEIVRSLQGVAREVAHIENSRDLLYGELRRPLGVAASDGFYDFLAKLPPEERVELSALYRRLRLAVSQVRSATGGIDSYISATLSTMGRILEELFPSRRMKLYTRTGAKGGAEHPLVFSHSL